MGSILVATMACALGAQAWLAPPGPRTRPAQQRCRAANDGLVLAPTAGLVGEKALGSPVVHHYAGESEWVMWFHGRGGEAKCALPPLSTGRVGMASSKDGTRWERVEGIGEGGCVLRENSEEWWSFDTAHVGLGDVVPLSGDVGDRRYERRGQPMAMFYFAGSESETEWSELGVDRDGSVPAMDLRIGLAMSQGDGRLWGRVEGEFPTGEVVSSGDAGAWDSTYVGWPSVATVDGERYVYYQALDRRTRRHATGLAAAVAPDAIRFEKPLDRPVFEGGGAAFDAGGVSRRCVRKLGDLYYMWYEGLGADRATHAVGLATSPDGLDWTPLPDPVFRPSDRDDAWDNALVSSPYVVRLDDETLRMFYVGAPQGLSRSRMAIGAADSTDNGLSWTRVPSDLDYAPP